MVLPRSFHIWLGFVRGRLLAGVRVSVRVRRLIGGEISLAAVMVKHLSELTLTLSTNPNLDC